MPTPLRTDYANVTGGWLPADANAFATRINENTSAIATLSDEILEYTNLAGFPGTGVVGKVYLALDTNKLYRWNTGTSAYIEVSAGGGGGGTPDDGSVTVAKVAPSTLVTASEGIGSNNNDTTIPTSAAVKAYADAVGGSGGTPGAGTVTTTQIAPTTLVTASEGIGGNNNDTTIPTSAAVKAYADSLSGGADPSAPTHAATLKTTPVDADEFPISNSASSYALGKVNFATLKTWVKSWITKTDVGLSAVTNNAQYYPGGTDVALADGGTGASLADPNADRIMFWDDSTGAVDWLIPGTNLSITGNTINAAGATGQAFTYKTIADYVGPNSPNPGQPALNTAGGDWTFAMNAMAKDTHGNSVGVGGDAGRVVLPSGKGIFNGWDATVLTYACMNVTGQGSWHTLLTLNAPIIDLSGVTTGTLNLADMYLYAGTATDAIKVGNATDNGGNFRTICGVKFYGFTGYGIRITGTDTPYFDIARNTFAMGVGGIAMYCGGFTDNWVVQHNEFRAYKAGIVIANNSQSRIEVRNNNFMHVSDSNGAGRYDVVLCASTSTTSARGQGAIFHNNWHGPEGRTLSGVTYDLFYVIADLSGALPILGANSTNTIHGLRITGTTTYDMGTTPLVYTTMTGANMKACNIGKDGYRYGATGAPTLQFRDGTTPHNTNDIRALMDEFTPVATPDLSSSVSVSVDSEVMLFSGTTGKIAKRATGTGLARLVSGVMSLVSPTIDGQTFDGSTNITVVAPATAAATAKATPVDADKLPISDSAASGAIKSVSFAALKSWVKAYYDSVASVLTNKDLTSGTNTFPTLNQNTTGSAAKLTTPRAINGVNFDGTAAITIPMPYDISAFAFSGNTTRANGTGDNPMGIRLPRACTLTSVTYRGYTAGSGSLTVELRKNGAAVSGTSKTIAAADQLAGGANATAAGSWSFAAGDILTVYVTTFDTTPGKGLVADITGTA